jgi:hypothetical protein
MRNALIATLLLAAGLLTAQTAPKWDQFQFMIGKWKAETGDFSFQPEMNGQVLVRRNFNNTPGQKHEDLMVVYLEGTPKAIYFDSEGHTIHYNVAFPSKNAAVFESEGPGPKYRLVVPHERREARWTVRGRRQSLPQLDHNEGVVR